MLSDDKVWLDWLIDCDCDVETDADILSNDVSCEAERDLLDKVEFESGVGTAEAGTLSSRLVGAGEVTGGRVVAAATTTETPEGHG